MLKISLNISNMKFTLCALCFVAVAAVAVASSDAGYFIPKAFYKLSADGQKTNLHPVSPHTAHYLRRLRRQTYSSSSSSSSSVSSSSNGGAPVVFSSQQVLHQTPEAGYFATQVVQQSPDLGVASRFGEAPSIGNVVQTTGIIDPSGRVVYKTQEGHF